MTVLVLAPKQIGDYFASELEEKVQVSENIDEGFWRALAAGKYDANARIVIMHKALSKSPMFYNTIASFASEACVCIVGSNPDEEGVMRQKIYTAAQSSPDADSSAPYFFAYENPPLPEIISAYDEWELWRKGQVVEEEPEEDLYDEDEYDPSQETNLHGKVFTFTSSKGGSGKSTLSCLTASMIAKGSFLAARDGKMERPLKVVVWDLNLADSQLGFIIGKTSPTIVNLQQEGSDKRMFSNEEVSKICIHYDPFGVDFVLGPKVPQMAHSFTVEWLDNLLTALKRMYDIVIIDTSVDYVTDPAIKDIAYERATGIVYVTDLVVQTVAGTARWFKIVTGAKERGFMGISHGKIGVVVNRANIEDVPREKLHKAVGHDNIPLLTTIPDLPFSMIRAASDINRLDLLLEENDYGYSAGVYRLAMSLTSRKLPLVPLVKLRDKYMTRMDLSPAEQASQPNVTAALASKDMMGNLANMNLTPEQIEAAKQLLSAQSGGLGATKGAKRKSAKPKKKGLFSRK